MDKEFLFTEIKKVLVEQFDVEEDMILLDTNLYEELEIDSIDAVDLMVHIKELTGKKIPPEEFREIRTVRDVIETIDKL
jgi:acyl carrier protein